VHVDAEPLGNRAVRAAGLPQFEGQRAAFGDHLDLAGSSALPPTLRVCGVAPAAAAIGSAGKRCVGYASPWHLVILLCC
jgi:hypothetical protein